MENPPFADSEPSLLSETSVGSGRSTVEETMPDNTLHQCTDCGMRLSTKVQLLNHKRQHNPPQQYICALCGKAYNTKSSLKVHMNLHSNEKSFSCDQCPKSFLRRSSLYNHRKSHQLKECGFKCSVCDYLLLSEEALVEHERSHADRNGHNNYEVQCFVCGNILSTNIGLKLHITQMHPEMINGSQAKEHTCELCYKKFASKSYLQQHMKTHTAQKNHCCSQCDYSALTKDALRRHVDRIHLKLRKFECTICSKKFVSQPDRKLHMLRHYKMKPVQCDECEMRFYSTRELRKHKWAHTGQKPYTCDSCGVAYAYVESLRRHISTHLPEPVSCNQCSREFLCEKALTKHIRSHPPASHVFKCSDCDKCYKSFVRLQLHLSASNHTAFVFICRVCQFEFKSVSDLTAHCDETGHKSNIYQCDQCDQVFHNDKKLLHHTRYSHNRLQAQRSELDCNLGNSPIKNEIVSESEEGDDVYFREIVKAEFVKDEVSIEDFNVEEDIPIEGIEVTDLSALSDVFKCAECNKVFPSAEDCFNHCQSQHQAKLKTTVLLLDEQKDGVEVTEDDLVLGLETGGSKVLDSVELDIAFSPCIL